ncbi:MAG: glycosyl transferase, partial [Chitinophagaceae bacterium]|nr:glycosyl transferase [Polaromonas sp.]
MLPIFQRTSGFAAGQFHRLVSLVKRYPFRAALALPALVLLYVLVLIPFTPGVSDLRKAKSELPSVLLASDGSVLAEYRRSNRRWVAQDKISPHVVNALIAT